MIILSHTNLSGINLGGINLSGIKLGMPSGKGTEGEETFDPASFDQAWTVTGKTNDDEDRATVKNITGNGNDLVLSNFAFAGDSGYGLYGTSFVNSFWIKNSSLLDINPSRFTIPIDVGSNAILYTNIRGKVNNIPPFKINVSGLGNIQFYYYYVSSDNTRYGFRLKDGINNLPESHIANLDMDGWVGFGTIAGVNDNIIIEQIPDYEGYLVTDGVDDSVRSYFSFNLENNWTIVGDWKLLSSVYKAAGIVKPNQFYIYNDKTSLNLYLKQGKEGFNYNKKTFYALTSDGKIYDDNWNETLVDPVGTSVDILSKLSIGSNGNNYVQMIFKNLAIYNCILTKNQCINAYNYLQTLKEK